MIAAGHHPGRPRDDGRARDQGGRGVRTVRLPARCRRRCCSARSMDCRPTSMTSSTARAPCSKPPARRACASPGMPTSATACGRAASRPSPPWVAWRRTTTAWMARSPAATCADVLGADRRAVDDVSARRGQRLSRRRRQPAPADPVRRRQGRTNCERAETLRRRRSSKPASPRRHGDGRARRRRREARADVHRSSVPPSSQIFHAREARIRSRGPAQSRQGRAHPRPLRRLWRAAGARRPVAAFAPAAVLTAWRDRRSPSRTSPTRWSSACARHRTQAAAADRRRRHQALLWTAGAGDGARRGRSSRRRQLRSGRTRDHRARAARCSRKSRRCWPPGATTALRAAVLRRVGDAGRHGGRWTRGSRTPVARARCGITFSARALLDRRRPRAASFGGEVMKNVAGYDVSRLLAGSLGILGVLLDVSLKVLPGRPRHPDAANCGRREAEALLDAAARARQPLPEHRERVARWPLYVRLEGSLQSLDAAAAAIGGAGRRSAMPALAQRARADAAVLRLGARRCGECRCRRGGRRCDVELPRACVEWNGDAALVWERATASNRIRRRPRRRTRDASSVGAQDATAEVFAPLPAPLLRPASVAEARLRSGRHPEPGPHVRGPLRRAACTPNFAATRRHAARARGAGAVSAAACIAASACRPARRTASSATNSTVRAAASTWSSRWSKTRARDRNARDAPRPLPDLPRVRDRLSVRRAVRSHGRSRPRTDRAARAASRDLGTRSGATRWRGSGTRAADHAAAARRTGVRPGRCRPPCGSKVPARRTATGREAHCAGHAHPVGCCSKGCVQPGLAPQINAAAAQGARLARHHDDPGARRVGCCGALGHHLGSTATALVQARTNVDLCIAAARRRSRGHRESRPAAVECS